jgi:methanogenic corrinoid protein MtbC1
MPDPADYRLAFEQALLSQDRLAARRIFAEVVAGGKAVEQVERLIVPTLEQIGLSWEAGQVALSQVYLSGRLCEELMAGLLPTANLGVTQPSRVAIAVLEDYHLLGKRMVYSVLRASGIAVRDYGRVEVASLVSRAIGDGIKVLLISTLMLPSALHVREVRAGLWAAGANVRLIVGGAPFRLDAQLWREVGADAMGRNAGEAVELVTRFAGGGL